MHASTGASKWKACESPELVKSEEGPNGATRNGEPRNGSIESCWSGRNNLALTILLLGECGQFRRAWSHKIFLCAYAYFHWNPPFTKSWLQAWYSESESLMPNQELKVAVLNNARQWQCSFHRTKQNLTSCKIVCWSGVIKVIRLVSDVTNYILL